MSERSRTQETDRKIVITGRIICGSPLRNLEIGLAGLPDDAAIVRRTHTDEDGFFNFVIVEHDRAASQIEEDEYFLRLIDKKYDFCDAQTKRPGWLVAPAVPGREEFEQDAKGDVFIRMRMVHVKSTSRQSQSLESRIKLAYAIRTAYPDVLNNFLAEFLVSTEENYLDRRWYAILVLASNNKLRPEMRCSRKDLCTKLKISGTVLRRATALLTNDSVREVAEKVLSLPGVADELYLRQRT